MFEFHGFRNICKFSDVRFMERKAHILQFFKTENLEDVAETSRREPLVIADCPTNPILMGATDVFLRPIFVSLCKIRRGTLINRMVGKAKAVGRHAIDAGKGARKMLTAVEARFRRNIHHRKAGGFEQICRPVAAHSLNIIHERAFHIFFKQHRQIRAADPDHGRHLVQLEIMLIIVLDVGAGPPETLDANGLITMMKAPCHPDKQFIQLITDHAVLFWPVVFPFVMKSG